MESIRRFNAEKSQEEAPASLLNETAPSLNVSCCNETAIVESTIDSCKQRSSAMTAICIAPERYSTAISSSRKEPA